MTQRPEQVIRNYLDEHGDLEEVAIEHLLVSWNYEELTQEARSLIGTALMSVGVRVNPPLEVARKHGTVSLSVVRGEAAPSAPAPEPETPPEPPVARPARPAPPRPTLRSPKLPRRPARAPEPAPEPPEPAGADPEPGAPPAFEPKPPRRSRLRGLRLRKPKLPSPSRPRPEPKATPPEPPPEPEAKSEPEPQRTHTEARADESIWELPPLAAAALRPQVLIPVGGLIALVSLWLPWVEWATPIVVTFQFDRTVNAWTALGLEPVAIVLAVAFALATLLPRERLPKGWESLYPPIVSIVALAFGGLAVIIGLANLISPADSAVYNSATVRGGPLVALLGGLALTAGVWLGRPETDAAEPAPGSAEPTAPAASPGSPS